MLSLTVIDVNEGVVEGGLFWVIDNGGNTRQKNLLAQLGLTSRIVKCINDIHDKDLIDYSHVNPKLKSFVTDSVNYLKESLICK